jgi:two-component system, OmpR family, response regulator RegX3
MSNPQHILIAEDEEQVRDFLLRVVRRVAPDALVTTASNGAEALEAFVQHGSDLIITDHRMPVMSGLELLRAVRRVSSTPVIIISADPTVETSAIEDGATIFFFKPVTITQVMQAIRAVL